jgi:hypothetical protein
MASSSLSRSLLGFWLLIAILLAGCEKPTVDVNIHGVNYKDDAFSYYVADPTRLESAAGGELIDAFSAGGTACCFTLPRIWRPGIKVQISTTHWLPKLPDDSLPEVKETRVVEVPRYVDGKPGELWVVRAEDGGISVISSDVQPDHERWPGQVKGWPEPSLEYRRERWELYRHYEEGGVELYTSLLSQLASSPEAEAKEAWEHAKENEPASLKGFAGPEDPRYRSALKAHYLEGLERSQRRLKNVMEARP